MLLSKPLGHLVCVRFSLGLLDVVYYVNRFPKIGPSTYLYIQDPHVLLA